MQSAAPERHNGEAGGPVETEGKASKQRKAIDYHPMTCAELIAAKFDICFLAERHPRLPGNPSLYAVRKRR